MPGTSGVSGVHRSVPESPLVRRITPVKIGFLTAAFHELEVSFRETARWAADNGFECLEVPCVAFGGDEALPGPYIEAGKFTKSSARRMQDLLDETGLEISCLLYCDNMLAEEADQRRKKASTLRKTIRIAELMGVEVVSIFIGRDADLTIAENIRQAQRVFTPLIKLARDKGVKLAIENCPMMNWQFEGLPGNIAYSPILWDALFEMFDYEGLGLNFDPSHLVWLGIDYLGAAAAFAERIFHVHAKDTEVLHDRLRLTGILEARLGWWRYRVPGLGGIDWNRLISTLAESGYDGVLSIEHEDPVWRGTIEKTRKGLLIGKRTLERYVV